MKAIIAGSRDFEDYAYLCYCMQSLCLMERITEIVSGEARGADKLGERYAKENNIPVKLFPADWKKYGKSAGYIRNSEMLKYIKPDGILIVFWDGQSKGTLDMITRTQKAELKTFVFNYGENKTTNKIIDEDFKIGDVVIDSENKKGIIIYIGLSLDGKERYASVLYKSYTEWKQLNKLRSTGIHYPQLSRILENING